MSHGRNRHTDRAATRPIAVSNDVAFLLIIHYLHDFFKQLSKRDTGEIQGTVGDAIGCWGVVVTMS